MANLKRYGLFCDRKFACNCHLGECKDGTYVKFEDIKELLKPTTNKAITKLLNELEHIDTKFDRAMEIFKQLRT